MLGTVWSTLSRVLNQLCFTPWATQKKIHNRLDIDHEVKKLLAFLSQKPHPTYGIGTVNCNMYDTAWVSMVRKKQDSGDVSWAFPESFERVLESQASDGGWDPEGAEFDRIVSTLACLLAIKKHMNAEDDLKKTSDWERRLVRATDFLNRSLPALGEGTIAEDSLPIGAELWLPKMLQLVSEEAVSLESQPVLSWLLPIREKKLAKFPIAALYRPTLVTPAHSLEAFIDVADFSKLGSQKSFGGMMGSPASTAAYLIYSPAWDADAEGYLRHAISAGSGGRSGALPTTFPTTVFELAWVTVNILSSGLPLNEEIGSMLGSIGPKLQEMLERQGGVIGFAQDVCADADDTAKTLIALNLLGTPADPSALVNRYESENYFLTFGHERNPSVSTNAHVLLALLHRSHGKKYVSQAEKCVKFLCRTWFESDGLVQDKWNISPYYPTMLVCHALAKYISQWGGHVPRPTSRLLETRISLVLYQAMVRIIRTQNADGSWGPRKSLEESAYAVLALKKLLELPFDSGLRGLGLQAAEAGSRYLENGYNAGFTGDRLWVDKTVYSIQTVSKSYILSAIGAKVGKPLEPNQAGHLFDAPEAHVQKMEKFISRLPSFSQTPAWIVQCSVRESYMLIPELQEINFFSQKGVLDEKYLGYISCSFVASNNRDSHFVGADYLLMVLVITVATYQLDNYMDSFAMRLSDPELAELEASLLQKLSTHDPRTAGSPLIEQAGHGKVAAPQHGEDMGDVRRRFLPFIEFMLSAGNATASEYDKRNLRNELKSALLSQVAHVKNSRLSQQRKEGQSGWAGAGRLCAPDNQTFYAWLRGCGSDHVLYPVILKYMFCQLGEGQKDVFPTAYAKYLAEDFCRHSAAEVRLWNDCGGVARDREERVLNSIDFCEFRTLERSGGNADDDGMRTLGELARYEHRYVEMCLDELERHLQSPRQRKVMARLRMHQLVTDVWGEMYSMFKFSAGAPPA